MCSNSQEVNEDTEAVLEEGIADAIEPTDDDSQSEFLSFLVDLFQPTTGPERFEFTQGTTGALAIEYAPPLPVGELPTISFELLENPRGAVTLVNFNNEGLIEAADAVAERIAPQTGVPFDEDALRALANIASRAANALAAANARIRDAEAALVGAGDTSGE